MSGMQRTQERTLDLITKSSSAAPASHTRSFKTFWKANDDDDWWTVLQKWEKFRRKVETQLRIDYPRNQLAHMRLRTSTYTPADDDDRAADLAIHTFLVKHCSDGDTEMESVLSKPEFAGAGHAALPKKT